MLTQMHVRTDTLKWSSFSYKLVKMLSVCVDVCVCLSSNRCTQRLVILRAQSDLRTLIADQKVAQSELLYRSEAPAEIKMGVNRHFQAS